MVNGNICCFIVYPIRVWVCPVSGKASQEVFKVMNRSSARQDANCWRKPDWAFPRSILPALPAPSLCKVSGATYMHPGGKIR